MRIRALTLTTVIMLQASLLSYAANDTSLTKTGGAPVLTKQKRHTVNYTLKLDNTTNQNKTVDSVLVVLDKFNLSGAGIVTKVFYPDPTNQIVIEDLEAGRYYADIYVLGMYQKHFSSVLHVRKSTAKKGTTIRLEFKDFYTPGKAAIPPENTKFFAYTK